MPKLFDAIDESLDQISFLIQAFIIFTVLYTIAVTSDGKRVGVSPKNGTSLIFDEKGKETAKLADHTGKVTVVEFSSDRKTLASASENKAVRVWDAARGKQTVVLK